jgi:hypothetical protein
VLVRRAVDLAPGAAAADAHGAGLRIDLDVLERRQVDHHSSITFPITAAWLRVSSSDPEGQQHLPCLVGD